MKTLILKSNKTDFERFYIDHMQSDLVDTSAIYKFASGVLWYVAVVCIEKIGLIGSCFFDTWKDKLDQYDTVIIFDRNLNWNILKYIKTRNPNIRCIAWYWNPIMNIERRVFPKQYRELCEVWSFDQADCDKFSFIKNVQFYFPITNTTHYSIEYSAFFVGCDKGRYSIVDCISQKLNELGRKTFVGIVPDKNSDPSRQYIKEMAYEDIIDLIKKSECIIDVPQNSQDGITLRVLESLFWKKKLITTNTKIKEFDFYRKSNIMIWDDPSEQEIVEFFNSHYEMIDESIIHRYTFNGWLENFGI